MLENRFRLTFLFRSAGDQRNRKTRSVRHSAVCRDRSHTLRERGGEKLVQKIRRDCLAWLVSSAVPFSTSPDCQLAGIDRRRPGLKRSSDLRQAASLRPPNWTMTATGGESYSAKRRDAFPGIRFFGVRRQAALKAMEPLYGIEHRANILERHWVRVRHDLEDTPGLVSPFVFLLCRRAMSKLLPKASTEPAPLRCAWLGRYR